MPVQILLHSAAAAAATYARVERDVFAPVEGVVWQRLSAHSEGPIGDAMQLLLDAGKADGSVREDVEPRDVIVLISWLSRLDDVEFDLRAQRLLGLVLDGLRGQ